MSIIVPEKCCLQRYCQNISISYRETIPVDWRTVHFRSSLYLFEVVCIFMLSFLRTHTNKGARFL